MIWFVRSPASAELYRYVMVVIVVVDVMIVRRWLWFCNGCCGDYGYSDSAGGCDDLFLAMVVAAVVSVLGWL